MKTYQHCGIEYKEVIPFSYKTYLWVVEVNGKQYKIEKLERPCKNYADQLKVIVGGKEYSSFSKFLKSII